LGVRGLLLREKTKLDGLKLAIEALKESTAPIDQFKEDHATILDKTVDEVTAADKTAIDAALEDYGKLSAGAKLLLGKEKLLLDRMNLKIEMDKTGANNQDKADVFKTTYADILSKTTDSVMLDDEAAVTDALADYNALKSTVKTQLTAEKTKLDGLKSKINDLKQGASPQELANNFKSNHYEILAKSALTVTARDEAAVDAALADYNALAQNVQIWLIVEKGKLDGMKRAIDALKH
jgi:uncharacterized protein with von Willebrand factor type A (vWA) domain